MKWLKKLVPAAAVAAVLALIFGGREKRNDKVDGLRKELAAKDLAAAKVRRDAAKAEARRRRSVARGLSPDDRAKGVLRRARERLRKDSK